MTRILFAATLLMSLTGTASAADDVVSAVAGTIKHVDAESKVVVVETDKGIKHTFHYSEKVTIHGAQDVARTPDEALKGLKDGTRVAIHYTVSGSRETAHEVDLLGDRCLMATKGTVTEIDRGSKVVAIKTADGTKETFHLTERASIDSGKDVAKGTDKATTVTVYYTEDAGKKIAHFLE